MSNPNSTPTQEKPLAQLHMQLQGVEALIATNEKNLDPSEGHAGYLKGLHQEAEEYRQAIRQQIEELLAAANPGPWFAHETGFGHSNIPTVYTTDDEELRFIARCNDGLHHIDHAPTRNVENTRLIAAAPTAIEHLLQQVTRLEAENEQLRKNLP